MESRWVLLPLAFISQQLIFKNCHTVGTLYANGPIKHIVLRTVSRLSKCAYILRFCAKRLDENVRQWTPVWSRVVHSFHWCRLVCVVALQSFGCVSAETCQRWGVCVCVSVFVTWNINGDGIAEAVMAGIQTDSKGVFKGKSSRSVIIHLYAVCSLNVYSLNYLVFSVCAPTFQTEYGCVVTTHNSKGR